MAERLELFGPWFANIKNGQRCKKCSRAYIDDDEEADEYGSGLCGDCFEDALYEWEAKRWARIARQNEY